MEIRNEIIEMLKQCVDPEIPVDLWNLGLIYNIDIKEKKDKLILSIKNDSLY